MYPFASLPENLAAFCERLRRDWGFHIGPGEMLDAARALDVVDLSNERIVRDALRTVLSGTVADTQRFDPAFTSFFFPGDGGAGQDGIPSTRREAAAGSGPETDVDGAKRPPPLADVDAADTSSGGDGPMTPLDADADAADAPTLFAPASYSPLEADTTDAPELPRVDGAWRDAARSLVRRVEAGPSRRWRPARRGRRFDFRRTLRASLQTGGEPLAARWLRRPHRSPRFVLLIDGSRSMSGHAGAPLAIAVALASVTSRVEVFTFSTALRRVTHDVRLAAAGSTRRLEHLHHAWAGGTSIGGCLRDFLRGFGARLVTRDTVVVIASDGLDVGGLETLRDAMGELHRRSAAVVWLNPLLETDGYEPTAGGMRTARAFVDTFVSVTDAVSLAGLARIVRVRT
jgi:uncharacterized protein